MRSDYKIGRTTHPMTVLQETLCCCCAAEKVTIGSIHILLTTLRDSVNFSTAILNQTQLKFKVNIPQPLTGGVMRYFVFKLKHVCRIQVKGYFLTH